MIDKEKLERLKERAKNSKIRSYKRHIINQQDKPQNRVRKALNTIRFSNRSGSYLNLFRYNSNNSDKHEDMKYKVFKYLRKLNIPVMVEPIFNNGFGKADILDCLNGIIYEITFTETEEELKEKIKKYPDIFEVRKIDVTKKFNEKMLL